MRACRRVAHLALDVRGERAELDARGIELLLRGVDLRVGEGEIHALVGANGSGKTTTVRILATLLSPSSGIARVLGIDVRRDPTAVRRRIGVALQEVGLDPLATGAELLRLQARLRGLRRHAAGRRAQELLGLSAVADRRISTYSDGTRRRLDLASALVCSPQLLLLDEPTTGLDPTSRVGVWREISRLRDAGTAVLLTTQYLDEADRLADHVWVRNQGHVARHGMPAELRAGIVGDGVTVELRDPRPGAASARRALCSRETGRARRRRRPRGHGTARRSRRSSPSGCARAESRRCG